MNSPLVIDVTYFVVPDSSGNSGNFENYGESASPQQELKSLDESQERSAADIIEKLLAEQIEERLNEFNLEESTSESFRVIRKRRFS